MHHFNFQFESQFSCAFQPCVYVQICGANIRTLFFGETLESRQQLFCIQTKFIIVLLLFYGDSQTVNCNRILVEIFLFKYSRVIVILSYQMIASLTCSKEILRLTNKWRHFMPRCYVSHVRWTLYLIIQLKN